MVCNLLVLHCFLLLLFSLLVWLASAVVYFCLFGVASVACVLGIVQMVFCYCFCVICSSVSGFPVCVNVMVFVLLLCYGIRFIITVVMLCGCLGLCIFIYFF